MSFANKMLQATSRGLVRGVLVVATAAAGASAYGLAEALRVHLGGSFFHDGAVTGVLLLGGLLGALPAGLALGLLVGPFLGGVSRPRRAWAGFLGGVLCVGFWDLAILWFSDPPPFADPFFLQGNLLAFAGIAALFALVWGLAVFLLEGRRGPIIGSLLVSLGLAVWVGLAVPLNTAPNKASASQPNLLWVTLDTVRADHMSAYGGRARTPAFDSLATDGVLFERAFAQIPVTGPSHTTMLTGQGPWSHGSLLNGVPIREELPTLPEQLQEAGYRTAAFVSAYVLDGGLGFERGFDVYDDELGMFKGLPDLIFFRTLDMARRHFDPDTVVERRGDATTDDALAWLAQQEQPWFLWLHLFDPHGPYEPPSPYDSAYYEGDPRDPDATPVVELHDVAPYLHQSLRGVTDSDWIVAQYDGEISFADQQLARVLALVDQKGWENFTVVVVNGDHGEALGEHDLWFDHGDDLYDPSTHVPLAIRLPHGELAGERVIDPVELVDLAPTMLDLLGLSAPDSMEGRSLRDTMQSTGHRMQARGLCFDRPANVAAREQGLLDKPTWRLASLRARESLYVHRESPEHPDEYYDMTVDPAQSTDQLEIQLQDPQGAQLMGLLQKQAADLAGGMASELVERSNAETSDEMTDALRALGYLD